jgi:hypothetical protein
LVHRRRRKRPGIPADERTSDEEFRRPGGVISRESRGEARRGGDHLIVVEIDGHYSRGISGELLRRVSVSREGREETAEGMMLTGGSHQSARGRERGGTASGLARWAAG